MNKQVHADRAHAQWSASASSRNWTCAGAIAMSTLAGDEVESIHAARGTAMHEVSELALRNDTDCIECMGMTVRTKMHEIEVDEECCVNAQVYVDYVRSRNYHWLLIEKNFSLAPLEPPFDAGGTCDAIGMLLDERTLEVVDLKGGMGIVDVNDNKQLRTYGLCALLNLEPKQTEYIDKIKVTIVQPRAPHKDGRIRSETFHIAELIDWTNELRAAMAKSKAALDDFEEINGNRVKFDEWSEKWLTPGACTFCPAEALCPKLKTQALSITQETVRNWFEDPTLSAAALPKTNSVSLLSSDEIAHILDGLDMLDNWANAVRAYAFNQAENGVEIPGYVLVDKIGRRDWKEQDDDKQAEALAKTLSEAGVTLKGDIWQKKLSSPAQIEKAGGVKAKRAIEALWETPVKGKNLVSAAKTTREAAPSKVESFFEKPE